ncbi:hypothetical protein JKP88DRAFT_276922 [Tribonema minus]|uniref:Pentatricopeptide repeat-containing protein n=1 Tax=Tribonema minus TaxID=303371 RepID=A0A835Z225_9STRA|nr:hypothetical protein JKP88DRAFT_276922 [Tribonema minus]
MSTMASVPPKKATSAVDSKAEGVSSKASPAPPDKKQSSDSSNSTSGSGGGSKGTHSRGRRADGTSSSGGVSSGGVTHGGDAGQQELVRTALKQLTDAGLATSQDWARLVHAHVAARNTHDAELTLGEMVASGHKPEMTVCHAILRAKAKYLHRGGATVVLRRMEQSGTPPDLTAYNLALHTCCGSSAVLHADKILADMAAMGLAPNRHTFRGMLRACKQAQDCERALAVFRSVEAHYPVDVDADMWICLLDALSVCRQPQAVLTAAARMAERGLLPTAAIYVVIAKAHAELGDGAAAETALSSMRAAGLKVTEVALFKVAEGYAHGGHVDAAEQALEAAFRSSSTGAAATTAHMHAILAFMGACRRARDLPRALRWLRRLPSLGLAPSPRVVEVVVSVAHHAGDVAAADALWREAGGAAYFGLYKALVPPKERRGWIVLRDHPVRQPHAQSTALDLSNCDDVMMHVALRAEAERLRTQPPSATVCIYAYTPKSVGVKSVERAGVFHALDALEQLSRKLDAALVLEDVQKAEEFRKEFEWRTELLQACEPCLPAELVDLSEEMVTRLLDKIQEAGHRFGNVRISGTGDGSQNIELSNN